MRPDLLLLLLLLQMALLAQPMVVAALSASSLSCDVDWDTRVDCRLGSQGQCESAGCCGARHMTVRWRAGRFVECGESGRGWMGGGPSGTGGPAWCFYPAGTTPPSPPPGGDCSIYDGINAGIVVCAGQETVVVPEKVTRRYWQTPYEGQAGYQDSYGDAGSLVGYVQVVYDADHRSAQAKVLVWRRSNSTAPTLRYFYNGAESASPVFNATTNLTSSLLIKVVDGEHQLVLEPVDLLWNNPAVPTLPQHDNGQKGGVVEMFGWPHDDVAQECEFLAKAGYLGVKVFPVQEHVVSDRWLQNGERNPWYWNYQPVSYKLSSRMGTREQLRKMITTCRKLGVRVYADAVINHMSGGGNDRLEHRNNNQGSCVTWGSKDSTAGSFYATHPFTYQPNINTNEPPGLEYPSVPYFAEHFHCERSLASWNDPLSLDAGWLVGLADLNTDLHYVQQRIADYITELVGIGFSGIRIDAAKHMHPRALAAIFGKLKQNLGGRFPNDFFATLEVLVGGEAQLLCCNADSGYNYYLGLNAELRANGLSDVEIEQIKIFSADYPKEFPICGSWIIPPSRFTIQQDDHDQQNPGSSSRDMGDKGSVYIKDKDVTRHRNFNVELFARPAPTSTSDWKIRYVLSSYSFMNTGAAGFPDGLSSCSGADPTAGMCITMEYQKAHDATSCGYDTGNIDNWQEGKYTRVHRDRSVVMAMRKWLGLPTTVSNEEIGLPADCV